MVQGTTSDAGKSTLVTGLCRLLKRKGYKVAPFKPQNMALNSAVTKDGGEIGRAQAVQAYACGVSPTVDMNPVLIKPASDTGAQVIIQGQVMQNMDAQAFHEFKPSAKKAVLESFTRLRENFAVVVVEGAGSPAEINLREGDIANMGFAEAVDCPVVLIADINNGGVFAHIVGTLDLLSRSERDRIVGFVINKFRGDIALLDSGIQWLEKRTTKPVFGVIPYLHDFYADAEDAIDQRQRLQDDTASFTVVVPVLPRISNHTDFDALRYHPSVNVRFVSVTQTPPPADLVILPGSKSVRQDLQWLDDNNWPEYIQRHLRFGGKVLGLCGGYQMLGQTIEDEYGVEGEVGSTAGLGLIPITTYLDKEKILTKKSGSLHFQNTRCAVEGYEIHHGRSQGIAEENAVIFYDDHSFDGYLDSSNQIFGCYLHGLFDTPEAMGAILAWSGLRSKQHVDIAEIREKEINRLADVLENHLDVSRLFSSLFSAKSSKGQ